MIILTKIAITEILFMEIIYTEVITHQKWVCPVGTLLAAGWLHIGPAGQLCQCQVDRKQSS